MLNGVGIKMGVFSGFSPFGHAESSGLTLLLFSFCSFLYFYDLRNDTISSVLGCLIGSFLWLKFESFYHSDRGMRCLCSGTL